MIGIKLLCTREVISVLCLLDGTPQNRIVLDANSSLSAARAQIVDAFGLTGAVGETDIAWIVAANVVGVSTADKAAPVVVADESVVLNEAVKQFKSLIVSIRTSSARDVASAKAEVARLQKVEKNLNETVATRGTVLATLRKQIKDSNALVLNSAQKVAAFWRAQIDTEKARLDHIYKHFVGASPSVLDGGDFPPVPVDVPVDNDDAVDDDDDDNDDDDDDSGSSADKELVVPSKASASSSLNQKQKAVSTSSTSSSKSAADDDAENDGDHKSHASPRADVAPTLSKTLRATSVKPISFPADIKSCESKLREIWSRPVGTGTTFKDLPRLAKRVSLSVDGTAVTLPATATESTVATLAELIRAIALRLEAADKAALVSAACDALSAQDQHETPELHVGKVFELLGATSATEAVFRSIHQGVILPAALWLKAHTRVLSKDVTSDDGWTIAIAIESATKRVTVSHVRQEQSLSAEPADRFTLAYRLRFVLVGAELELCDMRFVEADWRSKTLSADVRSALAALDAWNQAADQLHQQAQ